jgi:riboflavin kinase / FMN adenylyltransferase
MKVVPLNEVEPGSRRRRVAIGTFDGVHLGHREVIRGADTVLTFDPHPLSVIHPEATPKLISTFPVRRDLIAGLGVEELVVIPFDKSFSEQSAEDFVQHVLLDRLGAVAVSVGENFRFGKGARGTPEFLSGHDEFETRVVPLVEAAGETVSSSHIRGLVAAGEVDQAAEFLGGPFLFEGVVVPGDKRGRELGMPTANLVPDDAYVTPGHGVYAGSANGHPAAVNVGVRPTFDTGRGLLVEAHLLDFDGDLYGQTLRIAFLDRLRGEKRFDSVDELVAQMKHDVEDARRITSLHSS